MQLDDDIQRGFLRVIRAERTDAERDLRLVTEVVIELLCAVEIKAVTEQQQLGFRVYAVLFVVCNHLLAPCIGVAAVMPDAGVVVDHRAVEVQQEQIRRDRIGQRGAVVALILVVPVLHGVVIRKGEGNGVDALIHLHEFVRIGADRRDIVLHRKIDIRGADAFVSLLTEPPHDHILPFARQSSAAAEFGKSECIRAVVQCFDLRVQLFLRRSAQPFVIKLHPEIDLVDDLQQVDLKLHRGEQRAVHNDLQLAVFIELCGHIIADRMPQAQKFDIIILDEADRAQIIQLLLLEAQRAEMVDLLVDLLHHLRRKDNAFVAAFEIILAAEIGVLVKNDLIHIEFIQIGVQQGNDNRIEFHGILPFVISIGGHRARKCTCSIRRRQIRVFFRRLRLYRPEICAACRTAGL